MIQRIHKISTLLLLVLIGILFFSGSINLNSIENGVVNGKFFFLIVVLIPIFFISLFQQRSLTHFRNNAVHPLGIADIIFLIFGLFLVITNTDRLLGNERFYWFSGLWLLYFVIVEVVQVNRLSKVVLIPFIGMMGVALFESIFGLCQLYHICPSNYEGLVTGSFNNPGPLAGFLLTPFAFAFAMNPQLKFKSNNHLKMIIAISTLITLILVSYIIGVSFSRAAWIGAVVAILIVLHYQPFAIRFRAKIIRLPLWIKGSVFFLALIALTALLILITTIKGDSASGRILIWLNTWEMIKDYPLFGVGFDKFQAHYMNYQAIYFEQHPNSVFHYVGGNVQRGFNDLFQLMAEMGIFGFALFAAWLGMLLIAPIRQVDENLRWMVVGAKAALLGTLAFSCFSYSFLSAPNMLMIIFSAAILSASTFKSKKFGRFGSLLFTWFFIPLLGAMCFYYAFTVGPKYQAYVAWKQGNFNYLHHQMPMAGDQFSIAQKELKYNGKFLMQHAKVLEMQNQHAESIQLLQEATPFYSDPIIHMSLGANYEKLHNYELAEEAYRKAMMMIPSKFYPLYRLFKLKQLLGEDEEAITLAHQIIEKKIKVDSPAIRQMKDEMGIFISAQLKEMH